MRETKCVCLFQKHFSALDLLAFISGPSSASVDSLGIITATELLLSLVLCPPGALLLLPCQPSSHLNIFQAIHLPLSRVVVVQEIV